MADSDKTYTESEHLAILADRVSTETASLSTQLDQAIKERDDARAKLDVAESAKVAAEQAAEKASQDFEAFKAEIETEREQAARKDERLKKVREVASHLPDEFFADEDRVKRIVAMDDAAFESYAGDLALAAPKGTSSTTTTTPRETAMQGAGSTAATGTDGPKASAASTVLLGRFRPSQEG